MAASLVDKDSVTADSFVAYTHAVVVGGGWVGRGEGTADHSNADSQLCVHVHIPVMTAVASTPCTSWCCPSAQTVHSQLEGLTVRPCSSTYTHRQSRTE